MKKTPLAHIKVNADGSKDEHPLEEHLRSVANLAFDFAKDFGADWARLAGLWHDLGKYRPKFQEYIAPESHLEGEKGRVDHSTAGAIHAINEFGEIGYILAYLIAGHHAGLPDWFGAELSVRSALEKRLESGREAKFMEEVLAETVPSGLLYHTLPPQKPLGGGAGLHLWIRMLFSCLVDADFLDTERFFSEEKSQLRTDWPNLKELKIKFDAYMVEKIQNAENTVVNQARREIFNACLVAGDKRSGIFTLTVPTGGGKTLSSMAFALRHAECHKKRRVIVVIPYTSIIEQTADVYRNIFGDSIVEHHSNLEPEKETPKSRIAAENWDAPIIVTTNVQLLESLFAARTSRCRKLHNLVNSIVIIDEAQLLPPEFLQPVLNVLNLLVKYYGVTLVLSTATQPALRSVEDIHGRTVINGLDETYEIIQNVADLYQKLSRVTVERPINLNERLSWEDIANDVSQYDQALAIVNTRKDCRDLFSLMPKGTVHLSGLMCGEHRSQVIKKIKEKLRNKEPIRVVSTQLVEAGVDLDFPVVYRAVAGLDSIAQAAGRCNREGRLKGNGRVVVFVPPKPSPKGMLLQAEQATRSVWHGWSGDPIDHKLYKPYFEQYFDVDKDKQGIISLLTKNVAKCAIEFRTAASKFRLIDDNMTAPILVHYNEEAEKLLALLKSKGPERFLLRKLQRYNVNLYIDEFEKLKKVGLIEEIQPNIYTLTNSDTYDQEIGLLAVESILNYDPERYVFN